MILLTILYTGWCYENSDRSIRISAVRPSQPKYFNSLDTYTGYTYTSILSM